MTQEEDAEVASIRAGADDFIKKPYNMPEVILARCERIIDLYEKKNLIDSAQADPLTGLYSNDFFFEYIRQFEQYNDAPMDAIVPIRFASTPSSTLKRSFLFCFFCSGAHFPSLSLT